MCLVIGFGTHSNRLTIAYTIINTVVKLHFSICLHYFGVCVQYKIKSTKVNYNRHQPSYQCFPFTNFMMQMHFDFILCHRYVYRSVSIGTLSFLIFPFSLHLPTFVIRKRKSRQNTLQVNWHSNVCVPHSSSFHYIYINVH